MNRGDAPLISIITPVLNEGGILIPVLKSWQSLREQGCELILVDGGSRELAEEAIRPWVDQLLITEAGRARQMNAGARAANADLLWFLHLDSQFQPDAAERVKEHAGQGRWGRFNIRLSGSHPMFRVIERMMNLRSRLTGIATGDQGIFMPRALYDAVGGFPEIALMEDVAICGRLKKIANPVSLSESLITSSRRWERRGIFKTMLLMWWLRLAFALGADPDRLARIYKPCSSPTAES